MTGVPTELFARLKAFNQDHLLTCWDKLTPDQQTEYISQLSAINLQEITSLVELARLKTSKPVDEAIQPLLVTPLIATARERERGEEALRCGEVAALIVAGGQGSRLGFDKPKGMFGVGPISGCSLFQIHAEKLLALSRRYGKPIPFLVMTSPATDAATRDYFHEQRYFGLHPSDVIFFRQGTMPAVSSQSGKLLLEERGRLFLSPNGHGGTLTAVVESGVLAEVKNRGVKQIYYFQVDNPLLRICDPAFLGRHILLESEVSSKVIFKERPEEKVGVFAMINDRCGMIEYSDMSNDLASEREPSGVLRFRAGNPAIHLFTVELLQRITSTGGLAYHIAHKAVPNFDPQTGLMVDPGSKPNAYKFERFIFDALPLAERWMAMETDRSEFAPLKNATGADSPETVRAAQIALYTSWFEQAGCSTQGFPVEVSPLFALDAEELQRNIPPDFAITGPLLLR